MSYSYSYTDHPDYPSSTEVAMGVSMFNKRIPANGQQHEYFVGNNYNYGYGNQNDSRRNTPQPVQPQQPQQQPQAQPQCLTLDSAINTLVDSRRMGSVNSVNAVWNKNQPQQMQPQNTNYQAPASGYSGYTPPVVNDQYCGGYGQYAQPQPQSTTTKDMWANKYTREQPIPAPNIDWNAVNNQSTPQNNVPHYPIPNTCTGYESVDTDMSLLDKAKFNFNQSI